MLWYGNGPITTGVTEFSRLLDRTARDLTNGGVGDEGWPRGSLDCSVRLDKAVRKDC